MKDAHSLPIIRLPLMREKAIYICPLGMMSSRKNYGPGIYVSENDERSDDEIRAAISNLDPRDAIA